MIASVRVTGVREEVEFLRGSCGRVEGTTSIVESKRMLGGGDIYLRKLENRRISEIYKKTIE